MALGEMNLEVQARCLLNHVAERSEHAHRGTLIGLHDEDSTHTDLLPALRAFAADRRIIAPRAARRAGIGGGYAWFSCVRAPLIEPVGFGDSLIQLEALALQIAGARAGAGTWLYGVGQGATMVLALSAVWPELFQKVVAVNGDWPVVPGWSLPDADMSTVRLLLVECSKSAREGLTVRNANFLEAAANDEDLQGIDACHRWLAGD